MSAQPEALRLSHVPLWNRDLQWHGAVTAELRRLHEHEIANREWLSKTDWAQESASGDELGMHRADGLKRRIDRLVAENEALREDAERYRYLRNRKTNEVLDNIGLAAGVWIDCEDKNGQLVLLTGADADEAIDAARSKT